MQPKTKENLKNAFAGESQAHMKYLIFADAAAGEGFPNIGRLFTAISFAERVHAVNHHGVLFGTRPTTENLETAIGGETFEVNDMYPGYKAAAEAEKAGDAVRSIHYALEAEKLHARLYSDARQSAQAGKDLRVEEIHVCPVCGYTVLGQAPGACPVCGTKKELFRKF